MECNRRKPTPATFKKGDPRASEAGKKKKVLLPLKQRHELKDNIFEIVTKYLPKVPEILDRLIAKNPDRALVHIISLAEFVLPRLARVEADINNNTQINIIVNALKERKLIEIKEDIQETKPDE